MNGVFVTGTDTAVGKTVVSAALLSVLGKGGIDVVPMKPVQTGCFLRGKELLAPDLEFCLRTVGMRVSKQKKRLMAPYCFKTACSPHLAVAETSRKIELNKIMDAFQSLKQDHDMVIVEGAGGVLVPLDDKETFMLDLMKAMGLPVILVSRPGLGTINHTLLSLRELRRAKLAVLGVIINETRSGSWGTIESDNIKTIERLGQVRVLAHLPCIRGLSTGNIEPELFKEHSIKHLPSAEEWMRGMVK